MLFQKSSGVYGFYSELTFFVTLFTSMVVLAIPSIFWHKGATKSQHLPKSPLHGNLMPAWMLIVALSVILVGYVLNDHLGCSTPAAYGPTISRISANIITQ